MQRCVNVRVGHQSKGHQSKDGKVFAVGDYVSSFSFNSYYEEFRNKVYCCLVALLDELAPRVQEGRAEVDAAASIHKDMVLTKFFLHTSSVGNQHSFRSFIHSHTACFCCLFGQAEVQLPCGHVVCEACLATYGKSRGETEYKLDSCPIEGLQARFKSSDGSSWRVRVKPKTAGIRVLSLDG